ncbi:MAG: M23 family metallopeptidase [Ardenticatenaceae bacterium]|nr:M23 family metallopeptidase [Ardenticatenaceae bacterium]MCB9444197.1 M23 family metallopeptidase [Ardenticatenaceae bacterium]
MSRIKVVQFLHKTRLGITISLIIVLFSFVTQVEAQTPFLITPYFGTHNINQGYNANHPAYDFDLVYTHIPAADSGMVTRVRWYDNRPECHHNSNNDDCGYGLHIYIQHSNGYTTRYAHLSSAAFNLNSTSIFVRSGQVIGTSGDTGWSTGPHLHFEVKDANNGNVDPFNPNIWEDGQWADPSHPFPEPPISSETIVDDNPNNTDGFSKRLFDK